MRNTALLATTTLGLALAAFAVACSDDDTDSTSTPGGSTTPGASTPAPGTVLPDGGVVPEEPPIYAVAQYVGTGQPTTYITVTDTLAGEVATTNATIQLPGQAIMNAIPGGKRLFVGTSVDTILRRYDLKTDGTLPVEPSATVDFQAAGLANLSGYGSGIQLVGPTRGYWLSWSGGKVVVFDQNEMIISKTLDVPAIVRDNPDTPGTPYTTSVTGYPILDGTTLYYFVSWDSRNGGVIKTASGSAVVAIDTTNDTAQVIPDLNGCSYARDGVVSGDWIYLASEAVGSSVNHLNAANGAAPCMRRFSRTTKQFDASFKVDLNPLAGGAPTGSLVTAPTGEAFVYVLDTAAAAGANVTNPRLLSVGAFWKTAKLTVGDTPSLQILDNPLTSSSVLPHQLKSMKVTATFDPSTQQVREVTGAGVVATDRANAKLNGNTGSIVQLQ